LKNIEIIAEHSAESVYQIVKTLITWLGWLLFQEAYSVDFSRHHNSTLKAGGVLTPGFGQTSQDLFQSGSAACCGGVDPDSIWEVSHQECFWPFSDEMFADLFDDVGRRPPAPASKAQQGRLTTRLRGPKRSARSLT